jgi:hypothetical protein
MSKIKSIIYLKLNNFRVKLRDWCWDFRDWCARKRGKP